MEIAKILLLLESHHSVIVLMFFQGSLKRTFLIVQNYFWVPRETACDSTILQQSHAEINTCVQFEIPQIGQLCL